MSLIHTSPHSESDRSATQHLDQSDSDLSQKVVKVVIAGGTLIATYFLVDWLVTNKKPSLSKASEVELSDLLASLKEKLLDVLVQLNTQTYDKTDS
ncbi:MAG: hypothetical protein QM669_02945 [Siphonobacter sp.]